MYCRKCVFLTLIKSLEPKCALTGKTAVSLSDIIGGSIYFQAALLQFEPWQLCELRLNLRTGRQVEGLGEDRKQTWTPESSTADGICHPLVTWRKPRRHKTSQAAPQAPGSQRGQWGQPGQNIRQNNAPLYINIVTVKSWTSPGLRLSWSEVINEKWVEGRSAKNLKQTSFTRPWTDFRAPLAARSPRCLVAVWLFQLIIHHPASDRWTGPK